MGLGGPGMAASPALAAAAACLCFLGKSGVDDGESHGMDRGTGRATLAISLQFGPHVAFGFGPNIWAATAAGCSGAKRGSF